MSKHHWHAMNGSSGCMPDNNEVHTSKASAVRSLCDLFYNERGLYTALMTSGLFHFPNPREVGAEIAEVCRCTEDECMEEENSW